MSDHRVFASASTSRARPCLSALLISSSVLALISADPAWATCDVQTSSVCDNTSSFGQHLTPNGAAGTGDNDGDDAPSITLNNDVAVSLSGNLNDSSEVQIGGLFILGTGGAGSYDTSNDATRAGDGGTQIITNTGSVSLTSITLDTYDNVRDGDQPGIFDNGNLITGLYATAAGGLGADANQTVIGGGDGGRGGDGGNVTITNSGAITLNTNAVNGLVGIYGASIAGPGGDQDKAATGDQVGGNGGDGKTVTIDNSASVSVSSGNAAGEVWGIGAEGLGNNGGFNAADSGSGAQVTVTNTGTVSVNASGPQITSLRGMSARSQGGVGSASSDGSDEGGQGEGAKEVTITNSGDISVSSYDLAAPDTEADQSAAIVLISRGGDGGQGPQNIEIFDTQTAGQGGDGSTTDGETAGESLLVVNGGATISAQGDFVAGIYAVTEGGTGADGREDSAGGDGGYGGNLRVELSDNATVQTTGANAAGVIVRAAGGAGGNVLTSSGIVDTGASEAGDGGRSGNAELWLGFTLDDNNDEAIIQNGPATIITSGNGSTGALVQAVGGGGGGVTSNFELFGQPASQSGGGGTGESVFLEGFATVTTYGTASAGLLAQSIGGGGGLPGDDSGLIAVGGNGGIGANSTFTTVAFSGSVSTQGDESIGILAQGIGGGGGAGAGAQGVATVGGQGGSGGIGGEINVTLPDTQITTQGDFSYGVAAQSVGGGGGDGGSVFDLSLLPTGDPIPVVGVGGAGDTGGNGDSVTLSNLSTSDQAADIVGALQVSTAGSNAHGLVAQSIGGGGGSGGNAVGLSTFSPSTFQIAGAADGGGDGDQTTVTLDDFAVTTSGAHAAGIVSQSIGGGGGTGGSASAKDINLILSISASVGGVGGDGGASGPTAVSLSNGTITTGGNDATDAFGIVAQSIGGGGGMAGSSTADAKALALEIDDIPPVGVSIDATVGGVGGSGGAGGPQVSGTQAVQVDLTATQLQTSGDGSTGIVAQSIGGGGGTGGSASSTAGVVGGSGSVGGSLSFAMGGRGGSGGAGDQVLVNLDGASSIGTYGDYANGILAQSIGGGGGAGGPGAASTSSAASGFSLTADMSVGGVGSTGGSGGAVAVDLAQGSVLATYGSGANAVVAQSIGGGGGASQGSSFGVSVSGSSGEGTEETEAEVTANLSVGADGGAAGDGNSLSVNAYGVVATQGGDANGYVLQSIGGGGGMAGSAGSDADDEDDSDSDGSQFGGGDEGTSYSFDMALGGSGGTSGNGGDITLDYRGQSSTMGDYADGIVVQSIGGGGGTGGTATAEGSEASANINIAVGGQGGSGGHGGTITASFNDSNSNQISTQGYGAYGVLLQSIGGGGGQGADGSEFAQGHLSVSGGSGTPGNGGTVTVSDYIYELTTTGDDAVGFAAQSIGGGGGVGLAGSSASTDDPGSHSIDVVLGGSPGSQAADVSVSLGSNEFTTQGDRAFGIVAQSIAGGGGIASVGDVSGIASLTVGQSYVSSNRSGNVDVAWTDASKTLQTSGDGAHAIIAQSISGAGGIAGDSSSGDYSTDFADESVRSSGTAGAVEVTNTGAILTQGENAFGIIAQSLGGNGGLIGGPEGTTIGLYGLSDSSASGAVTVTANGRIETQGQGAIAIFAQSLGDSQGTIDVTVSNTVIGGSGTGQAAGIVVHGGNDNNMVTVDQGVAVSAASGTAVRYEQSYLASGQLTVQNAGQITGAITGTANADQTAQVTGAPAAVVVNNAETGVLSGADLYQAHIRNAGHLIVGSRMDPDDSQPHGFRALQIQGDLTQLGTGRMILSTDFEQGMTDSLHVTGDVALDGTLEVETASIIHGATVRLLTADGRISGAFADIDTRIFEYDVAPTGNSLDLTVAGADFDQAGFGLTRSQSDIANHLQQVFYAGDQGFGPTFAGLEAAAKSGNDSLATAYTSLTSQAASVGAAMNFKQSRLRFNDLLACDAFGSADSFDRAGTCLDLTAGRQEFDQSADGNALGYDGALNTLGINGQHVLDSGLIFSGALGYESSTFNYGGSNSQTTGDTVHVAAALTRDWDNFSLSVALGGSSGSFDITRNTNVAGQTATATGSYDATSFAARVRGAYRFPVQKGHLRALLDIDVITARMDQYTETGAGALNLTVEDSNQTAVVATPSLEFGRFLTLGGGLQLKAYGTIGASFSSLDSYDTQARFAAASAGSGSFTNQVAVAPVAGNVTIGAQLLGVNNMSAGLEYNGSFAQGFSGHRASLSLRWRF